MIPRRKGEFYWRQFAAFRALGVRTVFVGMFDEVDEGTAIYKVADQTHLYLMISKDSIELSVITLADATDQVAATQRLAEEMLLSFKAAADK